MSCFTRLGTRPVTCFSYSEQEDFERSDYCSGIEVEQLKLKFLCVCGTLRLVRRRPGGELGEPEKTLSVLLSFETEPLPDKVMLGYVRYPVSPNNLCRTH